MNYWRYALAIVLSGAVMFLWMAYFAPQPPRRPPAQPAALPQNPPAPPVSKTPAEKAAPAPKTAPEIVRPAREAQQVPFTVQGRFDATAESRGGALSKVFLPEFQEAVDRNDPYLFLSAGATEPGILALEVVDATNPSKPPVVPASENWETEQLAEGDRAKLAVFRNEVDGVRIRKTILLGGPEYAAQDGEGGTPRHLKLRIELENTGPEARDITYVLHGPLGIDSESFQSPGSDLELAIGSWGRNDSVVVESLPAAKVTAKEIGDSAHPMAWVGLMNNYFAAILFPLPRDPRAGPRADWFERATVDSYPDPASLEKLAREQHGRAFADLDPRAAAALGEKATKNLRTSLRTKKIALAPGASVVQEVGLYLGPRSRDALEPYAPLDLAAMNQYGMFGFLVKFFIWLLGVLRAVAFGSWGLAIIFLTFLVKLCLHPINRRSQAGMARFQKKMQKVKPQLDALKEQFGDNRLKLNQEMQKLFREQGINPAQQMAGCLLMGINPAQQMAGCLLIFLQLPVWWGLYSTLQHALGLRQAGFLYIQDLTRPDMLFHTGASGIPFLGHFIGDYFNLLPVLYVVLTVVNQQLQPRPDDPQMQAQFRMMTFMLIFFGFLFYQFPAGFLLYFITSAALGIAESKIIKAMIASEDRALAAAGGPAGVGVAGPAAMYPARSRKPDGEAGGNGRVGRGSRR